MLEVTVDHDFAIDAKSNEDDVDTKSEYSCSYTDNRDVVDGESHTDQHVDDHPDHERNQKESFRLGFIIVATGRYKQQNTCDARNDVHSKTCASDGINDISHSIDATRVLVSEQ